MSRIGKKPIAMPAGVTATVESGTLTVKGPKGQLAMQLLDDLVKYEVAEGEIRVTPLVDAQRNRAAWGMQRTLLQNLVTGVTEGFTKVLEISGVGYRAQAQGKNLRLQLGYSHDVNFPVPEGIEVKTPDQNTVEISGIDRQKVGQVAAEIRRWRKPEPYKPRLSIHRSGRHIYAQVIDDTAGVTLAAASTLDKDLKGKTGATKDGAAKVGKTLAERAKKAGVSRVVFDRGGFLFHGRVKALADAAREGGLEF